MSTPNQPRIERPKRLGRPPDPAKVEAILDTGWAMLLARGYEATSIEAVAAEAGVSRVTVYRHFADKGALFREAVLRATRRIEAEQNRQDRDAASGMPLAARLERFGVALMTFLVSPTAVAFYGVLSGELRRHPDVAQAFYDLGPARTLRNLALILSEAAQRDEIVLTVPPDRAAEMLVGLWQGYSNYRLALDIDGTERDPGQLEAQVREGVAVFLNGAVRTTA
jgi:TetR/AcrR family transcriptional repressor of mexJK operon